MYVLCLTFSFFRDLGSGEEDNFEGALREYVVGNIGVWRRVFPSSILVVPFLSALDCTGGSYNLHGQSLLASIL